MPRIARASMHPSPAFLSSVPISSSKQFRLHQNSQLFVFVFFIIWVATVRYSLNQKMSSPSKRRDMDVMKLMMSDYTVETINDGISEFNVEFHGPKESYYEGGVWKVRVELPDAYPYKSPSIGFLNKIFHPNVDEQSGSVCLDVINQSWSPMFGTYL